jgi:hypothetical protein
MFYGILVGHLYWTNSGGWSENRAEARQFAEMIEAEAIRKSWVTAVKALEDVICLVLWVKD